MTHARNMLTFTKMHACGNDYVYVNCFDRTIRRPAELSVKISARHTGIGADGLVLIMRSEIADAKMRMFNADGSEGAMCGNAVRCVAKYLRDHRMTRKHRLRIETKSGVKKCEAGPNPRIITADMGAPRYLCGEIPALIGGANYGITRVSMGNPHAVVFAENIASLDLPAIGPLFENSPLFPDRVNTEFVEIIGREKLKMRVWERGSGETQACGTGACAAVAAAIAKGFCDQNTDVTVSLPGGDLIVKKTDDTILMSGECVKVFEGTFDEAR